MVLLLGYSMQIPLYYLELGHDLFLLQSSEFIIQSSSTPNAVNNVIT
jgi:hypothetical protein